MTAGQTPQRQAGIQAHVAAGRWRWLVAVTLSVAVHGALAAAAWRMPQRRESPPEPHTVTRRAVPVLGELHTVATTRAEVAASSAPSAAAPLPTRSADTPAAATPPSRPLRPRTPARTTPIAADAAQPPQPMATAHGHVAVAPAATAGPHAAATGEASAAEPVTGLHDGGTDAQGALDGSRKPTTAGPLAAGGPEAAASCSGGRAWLATLSGHLQRCLERWNGASPVCAAATVLRLHVRHDGSLAAPGQMAQGCGMPHADRAVLAALASCVPLPPLPATCPAVLVDVPVRFSEPDGE